MERLVLLALLLVASSASAGSTCPACAYFEHFDRSHLSTPCDDEREAWVLQTPAAYIDCDETSVNFEGQSAQLIDRGPGDGPGDTNNRLDMMPISLSSDTTCIQFQMLLDDHTGLVPEQNMIVHGATDGLGNWALRTRGVEGAGYKVRLTCSNDTTDTAEATLSPGSDTWHEFRMEYTTSTGFCSFWVNDTLVGTADGQDDAPATNPPKLRLAQNDAWDTDQFFDEIRIWDGPCGSIPPPPGVPTLPFWARLLLGPLIVSVAWSHAGRLGNRSPGRGRHPPERPHIAADTAGATPLDAGHADRVLSA